MAKITIFGIIALFLIFLEIIISGYSVYKEQNNSQKICVLGESCSSVQNSAYGKFFGIKLPVIALFAFAFLFISYFFFYKIYILGNIIGATFSIYLTSIQIFILKELCSTCVLIDTMMLLICFFSLLDYKNKN